MTPAWYPIVRVVATLLVLGLWGCAVVRIQTDSKDDVDVKTRFGIVSVEIKPGAKAVIVESTSFGIVNSLQGLAVGYHNASIAALGDNRCQLVVWIKTDGQLQELNSLLRDHADVCVVSSNR